MNAVRHSTSSMLRLGALVVGFGVWLLVTNLVGLWLSRHVAILGSLVLGSWPMLLIAGASSYWRSASSAGRTPSRGVR